MALGTGKKKKIVLKNNKKNKKNFYSIFSSKKPREPRLLSSYMEQGKLLIENTLFDKFYHCFNLQIIHKSTVTHSILFNLWNYIKLALFHRNYFQPPKKFPGDIYSISWHLSHSKVPLLSLSLTSCEINRDWGDPPIRLSMLSMFERGDEKGWLAGLGVGTTLHFY